MAHLVHCVRMAQTTPDLLLACEEREVSRFRIGFVGFEVGWFFGSDFYGLLKRGVCAFRSDALYSRVFQ